jgi:tetratricopeptide (TPR) repeat protein
MNAMAHVQKGDKSSALARARQAVAKGGRDPKEPWLQLVASLLIEQKAYAEAVPVLQQLIERYPKKNYWLRLSAVYSGMEQSDNALAVLELAYRQGLLTQRNELMTLAQVYLQREDWHEAEQNFQQAVAYEPVKANAEYWLKQLAAQRQEHGEPAKVARNAAAPSTCPPRARGTGRGARGRPLAAGGDVG